MHRPGTAVSSGHMSQAASLGDFILENRGQSLYMNRNIYVSILLTQPSDFYNDEPVFLKVELLNNCQERFFMGDMFCRS
jgi:hypothetical protein